MRALALWLMLMTAPTVAAALETGTALVVHEDPPTRAGQAVFTTEVLLDSGARVPVHRGAAPYRTDIQHGDRVLATRVGASVSKAGATSASGWRIEPLAVRQKLAAAPYGINEGTQRGIIIAINFSNDQRAVFTPTELAYYSTFTSQFFRAQSYQQTTLTLDAVGVYTVPLAVSSGCPYWTFQSLGDQAAAAAGVNLSLYQRRVYIFPFQAGCKWAGLGTIGGNPSSAWLNGKGSLTAMDHELGHNFGLYHSHACDDWRSLPPCVKREYGDLTDTMGAGGPFNPFQKERLDWLKGSLLLVKQSGSYPIVDYGTQEGAGQSIKALRIPRGTPGQSFYVALHTPGAGKGPPGVHLYTARDGDGDSSYFFDPTPEDTYPFQSLPVGRSFTLDGVTITTRSIAPDQMSAVIDVALAGTPPPPPPPPPPTCPPTCTPPPPPVGDVATQGFVYQGGGSGKFIVRAGAYTCERWMDGSVRIAKGTKLLKAGPLKNAVKGVPFTLTCAVEPTRVVLSVDGAVKLTAAP